MIFIRCLFIFFFASTRANGVYRSVSETYPSRIRSNGMAVATTAKWMWSFLISLFTPFITSVIHLYHGFMSHILLCKNHRGSLSEELDGLYVAHLPPWNTTGWTHSSAEEMAQATESAEAANATNKHV